MATKKISALTDLGASPDTGDLFVVVDVSDTTDSAAGTTKKITAGDLLAGFVSYSDTTANFTGTLQNGGSNVLVDTDIGATVLAYDSNLSAFVSAFTLPTADGSTGQAVVTDGAGTLSVGTPTVGVITATAAGAIADGDPLVVNSTGTVGKPSVTTDALTSENFIGFAQGAAADTATVTVRLVGVDDAQTGLTAGQAYYVQTNGTLSTTPGTPSVYAGVAISATQILVKG